MRSVRQLIWYDGTAGLVSGLVVLWLQPIFLSLHQWPKAFILFHGIVSLAYGTYALNLAWQQPRGLSRIRFLAGANMAWGLLCMSTVLALWSQISGWGIAHLLAESGIVGSLGVYEWKQQKRLV